MTHHEELGAIARAIVDSNHYMALGTADESGRPWVSPVYYTAAGYRQFFWVSSPQARHSINLATRPEVSIVIFDSQAPIGAGQGVYMSAVAVELRGVELDRGIEIFSNGSQARGARAWAAADEQGGVAPVVEDSGDVRSPALHRLYRATASEHSILDPAGHPVHGHAQDHRRPVTL